MACEVCTARVGDAEAVALRIMRELYADRPRDSFIDNLCELHLRMVEDDSPSHDEVGPWVG